MPKAMFFRPTKKGKVAPVQKPVEPDGDEAAQEEEAGNTNAPGPLTKKVGGQSEAGSVVKKSVKKATAEDDPAEPDADDEIEMGAGPNPPGGSKQGAKGATSDAPKVSEPVKPTTLSDTRGKPWKKKGATFGKPGSPIRVDF